MKLLAVVVLLMRVAGTPVFEAGGVVAGTLGLEVAGEMALEVAGVMGRVVGRFGFELTGTLTPVEGTFGPELAGVLARVEAMLAVSVLMILVADGGVTAWSHLYAESSRGSNLESVTLNFW